jgi:HEAT repeat protein
VRRWAARALGEIGTEARPAVPHLMAALNADDVKERAVAAVAVRKILYPERQPA